jgi:hypothetical protein
VKPARERKSKGNQRLFITALGILWFIVAAALWINWERTGPRVDVTWETATEQGTAGFRLYRREGENGEFVPVSADHFVQNLGGPTSGATYRYRDDQVEAGKTYFYLLEEIEADGSRHRYVNELLEYQVQDTIWWHAALIVLCCLAGAGMLFAGLRVF